MSGQLRLPADIIIKLGMLGFPRAAAGAKKVKEKDSRVSNSILNQHSLPYRYSSTPVLSRFQRLYLTERLAEAPTVLLHMRP